MKRDLDLVRCILITSEDAPGPINEAVLSNCCDDLRKVAFHVELMRSHGLIDAEVSYDGFRRTPLDIEVKGLTWEGYDHLDAIRSPQVWAKAKEAIGKAVGDTSLSVVKDVCAMVATSLVKVQLGI